MGTPRRLDLIVIVALAAIAAALALSGVNSPAARILFGLPLVFIAPGYALTAASFRMGSLGLPDRIAFILGLSLACAVLGGLILNWTPFGLRTASWAVLMCAITFAGCGVAFLRWRTDAHPADARSFIGLKPRAALLFAFAVVVTAGAIGLSAAGQAQQQASEGYVQFWILPVSKSASDEQTVSVGVSNQQSRTMQFRLVIQQDGKTVQMWPAITVKPHETWVTKRTLQAPASTISAPSGSQGEEVEAILYRSDTPTAVYRHVQLWLTP